RPSVAARLQPAPALAFRVAPPRTRWYNDRNRGDASHAARSIGNPRRAREGARFLTPSDIHPADPVRAGSFRMNKGEFVEAVADAAELTKADAGRAVDAMVSVITRALKKGDTVTLVGFGTFD